MENVNNFINLFKTVWNEGFLGIDIGTILISAFIFIFFLLLRKIFTKFILSRLIKWTKTTNVDWDEKIVLLMQQPFRFLFVILGVYFSISWLNLPEQYSDVTDKLLKTLASIAVFWALRNAVDGFSHLFYRISKVLSEELSEWLAKAAKIAIILIGLATILEMWGIKVAPIIAGFGLFGVAVALGAQDLFKNLISGALVLAENRFSKGDWILVDGIVEGTVETIGFRSTMIRRFDQAPVHVPNSKLSDNAVTNFSAMLYRRIYWKVGISLDTSIDQLKNIRSNLEKYIIENEEFVNPSNISTFVRIDDIDRDCINIMIYCFTKTTNWGQWLRIKEDLAYKVKETVINEGSSLALPANKIYIEMENEQCQ